MVAPEMPIIEGDRVRDEAGHVGSRGGETMPLRPPLYGNSPVSLYGDSPVSIEVLSIEVFKDDDLQSSSSSSKTL